MKKRSYTHVQALLPEIRGSVNSFSHFSMLFSFYQIILYFSLI